METQSLILASQSPRRYQLLTEAGYNVSVIIPDDAAEDEAILPETPAEMVVHLATVKAENVAQKIDSGLIVAGDTLAEIDGKPLGKPRDRDHAREILKSLRGREHRVLSGLCVWDVIKGHSISRYEQTIVEMMPLTDEEIEEYLDSGLWQGKAGAFGLQDRTGWVRLVSGSESNVVGLPMELLCEMLQEF